MADLIAALRAGALLAAGYNPVFALVGAAAAAAMLARGRGARRAFAAWCVLGAAWLVGDGMRIIASARNLADGTGALLPAAPEWASWVAIAVWALGSLLVAYVAPAAAGAYVGRRVTWGTGWLSAAAVSVGFSLSLAAVAGAAFA